MIWTIPVSKDTTIYESDQYRNSGQDPILQISKLGDVTTNNVSEERVLLGFDQSNLSQILNKHSIDITDITASLRLYVASAYEVSDASYIICRPISNVSWLEGTGYHTYPMGTISSTAITDGATWETTKGLGSTTWISSASGSATASYEYIPGGGSYITGSIYSGSLNFEDTPFLEIDITDYVVSNYNTSSSNNGLLLSLNTEYIQASNSPETVIQLYSKNTNTVYQPNIYVGWNSNSYITGSNPVAEHIDNIVVYTDSTGNHLKSNTYQRIYVNARKRYPRATFQQNSEYLSKLTFPSQSFYRIIDAHNDVTIIPYSPNTLLNTSGSITYFDFYTTPLYPERYYRYEIRCIYDDGIVQDFNDQSFTFKVVK